MTVLTAMAAPPVDILFCSGDINHHLDGICRLTREYLQFNYPDVIRTLFTDCPEGFQVALDGHKVIGVCILTILDEREAFVSIMAVDSGYRRRGVATRLYRACEGVAAGRNISLYAEPDAVPFYRRVGFKMGTQPSEVYFSSIIPNRDIVQEKNDLDENIKIVPMPTVPFELFQKYDQSISMVDRKFWLRKIYDNSVNSVVTKDENGEICGYGGYVGMDDNTRIMLQPILAENVQIAEVILTSLLRKVPEGCQISFKVPKENVVGVELMKRIGLDIANCFVDAVVMYTKQQVPVSVNKVFSTLNGMNQPA